jgi:outer membrane protein assembly factor BamB
MSHVCRRVVLLLLVLGLGPVLHAADWPHWRGPDASGVSDETGLPVSWSGTENVGWIADLRGVGVSAPIVSGDRVFVTSQAGGSVRAPGNHPRLVQGRDAAAEGETAIAAADGPTVFLVEAFSRLDGRRLWEYRLEARGPLAPVHDKHNLASPSPVTDGRLVYAWFGTGQIIALDLTGQLVWQRHLGEEIGPFDIQWGHGSSPMLYGDLLMLLCDHGSASYLLAVDKETGEARWKTNRTPGTTSYSTPLAIEPSTGPELIINSSEGIEAYDPRTGASLWHIRETNRFPIPSPFYQDGVLYASRGYRSGPYMAIRPGGRGDVSSSHVLWRVDTGAPYISSLVHYQGLLYMANDVGVITAVDAGTGERVWQQRLDGVYSASPVAADGKVYFVSEDGHTLVLRAGRTPELLARNDIGERSVASPAIAGGRIFIRTDDKIFAIGAVAP